MMQISSMYIGHEEDFNFILFNHFQSKCPLGTGPRWPLYMNGMYEYIGHGEDAGFAFCHWISPL
jgi:hypothetical protein